MVECLAGVGEILISNLKLCINMYFTISIYALILTGNLELLSWAVQLSVPGNEIQYMDQTADDIAAEVGLINGGQIGNICGLFALISK